MPIDAKTSILKYTDKQGVEHDVIALQGKPGAKPVKGVDYFTDADKQEIVALTAEQIHGMDIHICIAGEYDSGTGVPIITDPVENMFYLVPSGENEPNLYSEWVYVGGAWERFGSAKVDLTNYATKDEVQAIDGKLDNVVVVDDSEDEEIELVTMSELNIVDEKVDGALSQISKLNTALIGVDETADALMEVVGV